MVEASIIPLPRPGVPEPYAFCSRKTSCKLQAHVEGGPIIRSAPLQGFGDRSSLGGQPYLEGGFDVVGRLDHSFFHLSEPRSGDADTGQKRRFDFHAGRV